jgi:hypothetical protein
MYRNPLGKEMNGYEFYLNAEWNHLSADNKY